MDKKPTGLKPFARRQQGRNALLNKLIRPRGAMARSEAAQVNVPQQHELVPFVRENMQRVMDGENVLEVLPELEYVAEIVISGILSSKDLITCSLIYDCETQAIDPDLIAELIREIRRFFTTTYPINELLYEVLYDTLFKTGSYAIAIIPESSVDRIINEGGKIGLERREEMVESFKTLGLIGDPEIKETEKVGIESFFSGLDSNRPNKVSHYTLKVDAGEVESTGLFNFHLTDNPDVLKVPRLSKQQAMADVTATYNNIRGGVALERANDFQYFDKGVYKNRNYSMKTVEEIRPVENNGRHTVGHPLAMHIPSESMILCHTPGDFTDPVGGFIVLDEQGMPVTRHSRFWNASANAWIMGNASSQLIQDAAVGMGIKRDDDPLREWTMSKLQDTFGDLIEAKLTQSFKSGKGASPMSIVRPDHVYRIMMARALARKSTQILYVPAEQLVYFAMDYTPDGVGRSRLDKTRIISTIRSSFALATMQGTILNASRNVKLTVKLTPEDRNGEKTIAQATQRVMEQYLSGIPYAGKPDDILAYIANAGIDVAVEGNDYYPSTEIDVQENQPDYKIPDATIDEAYLRKQARSMGADPDLVINPETIEFASQITTKNVFNAKRICQDQKILGPIITHWVKTYIYSDGTLIDQLSDIVLKFYDAKSKEDPKDPVALEFFTEGSVTNDGRIEENVEETKEVRNANPTKKKQSANQMVGKLLSIFTANLKVSLPEPDTGKLNSQMELFDKRMESVDKQLEKILPDGLYVGTVYDGKESAMRTLISSVLAYRWLSENDVDPDLLELFGDDPDKMDDILKRVSGAVLGRTESIVKITKKLEKGMESLAKRMNVEPDAESTFGNTFGGGGSGGSDDYSTDDNSNGEDEFGLDDFNEENNDSDNPDDQNQELDDTAEEPNNEPDAEPETPEPPPAPGDEAGGDKDQASSIDV